jgi:iron(III) transport system substrate-binding protein
MKHYRLHGNAALSSIVPQYLFSTEMFAVSSRATGLQDLFSKSLIMNTFVTNKKTAKPVAILLSSLMTMGLAVSVQAQTITIYSGRSKALVEPLLKQAETELGIKIDVRYGDTAELAVSLLEEGQNSKADIFFAQDAGALGTLEQKGQLSPISSNLLNQVPAAYRSPQGKWIGISGRARVLNYNTNLVRREELPSSIQDLTKPKWKGKVAWAPTNGSFQSFITAMRKLDGDTKTLAWLKGMKDNGTKIYGNNAAILDALNRGEIAVGLVNHYYLPNFKKNNPNAPIATHYTNRDAGSIVNVAGIGIMNSSKQKEASAKLVGYLLNPTSQTYFATKTNEYPLRTGVSAPVGQPALNRIAIPSINLSDLADLPGTLKLLQQAEVL